MEKILVRGKDAEPPMVDELDIQIVQYLSDGLTLKEVAIKLGMKVRFIENRRDRLRLIIGNKTAAHLCCIFLRQGLIT